ncbi:MAG: Gfo/Idh/MocA family oxidoreductase [Candidatus Omnitrophica bacterium]|jgi:predicted dehydrogenase|nr:Gfo/Idh/MocA family oxidoreductase [Candidatus Omnitrophota bacterium]
MRNERKKIRLGFIGTGMMGKSHIRVIKERFNTIAEVSAICDTNSRELKQANEMAPEAKPFSKWQDILNESLDGVIISTPIFTHAEISISALQAGIHVLCEKAIATTKEDCFKMVTEAEKSTKILMIGHENRYSPYYAKFKEILSSGIIGTPYLVWFKEARGRFHHKIDNWIQDKTRSGGALVDKTCHHFDLMNWYLGRKPSAVAAFGGTDVIKVLKTPNEIEDNAVVIVDYEKKARGTLSLCMFAPTYFPKSLEFGVFGDKGFMGGMESGIDISQNEIIVIQREKPEEVMEINRIFTCMKTANDAITFFVTPPKDGSMHNGFIEEHIAFLDVIKTGKKPLTEVKECLYGTLITLAAEESMQTNKVVKL